MASASATESLQQLVVDGLEAVKAAIETGNKDADKIQDAATHPELKQALVRGTERTATWNQRVDTALGSFQSANGEKTHNEPGVLGGLTSVAKRAVGITDSPIIEAIYRTGREITTHAADDRSRDLGIVSTGQLALHYHIAAFGSLASYADALGNEQAASLLKLCSDEAKAEDERHTALARTLLNQSTAAAA